MRADGDFFTLARARAGAEDQVERVLGVNCQTADFGAVHLEGPRDVAGLLAVAVEGQGGEVRRGEVDGVPFEDDGGLGRVAATEVWRRGGGSGEGGQDAGLEGTELGILGGFFGGVLGDVDVDDAPRGDVGREEDRGKLDLTGGANGQRAVYL